MVYWLYILAAIVLLMILVGLCTLVHELGHAFFAWWYAREGNFEIYVGAFGDRRRCLHWRWGRFLFFIHREPWLWGKGLHNAPGYIARHHRSELWIPLGGPLGSLGVAAVAWGGYMLYEPADFLGFGLVSAGILGGYDFLYNIVPQRQPLELDNGDLTYNDGYQVLRYFTHKPLRRRFVELSELAETSDWGSWEKLLEASLATPALAKPELLRYGLACYSFLSHPERAPGLADRLAEVQKLGPTDRQHLAVALARMGLYEAALAELTYLDGLLADEHPLLPSVQANYAYILLLQGQYAAAADLFGQLLAASPDDAYVLSHWAIANYRMGQTEAVAASLHRALELSPQHAYVLYNLASYELAEGRPTQAGVYLEQVQTLNPFIEGLAELRSQAGLPPAPA